MKPRLKLIFESLKLQSWSIEAMASVEHRLRFLKFPFLRFCGAVYVVFSVFTKFHM